MDYEVKVKGVLPLSNCKKRDLLINIIVRFLFLKMLYGLILTDYL